MRFYLNIFQKHYNYISKAVFKKYCVNSYLRTIVMILYFQKQILKIA